MKIGLTVGAGLLVASCALDSPMESPGVSYVPIPASSLVSRRDLQFKVVNQHHGDVRETQVVHFSGGSRTVVGTISHSNRQTPSRISVRPSVPEGQPELYIATIENLYVLAMHENPEAQFCLATTPRRCESTVAWKPQSDLFRELARERQSRSPLVPWTLAEMTPLPAGGDVDEVGVRVTTEQRPLEGVTIFFSQAPHSGCTAKTSSDGIATCHLVDQHGDEETHRHETKAAVIATYPGDVGPSLIRPPTTAVIIPR